MIKNTFSRILLLAINLLLIISVLNLKASDETDHSDDEKHGIGAEELIRGERLFFGLVYKADKSINCASCHNTRVIDSINWNPDAYEISLKYASLTADDLSTVLLKPRDRNWQNPIRILI